MYDILNLNSKAIDKLRGIAKDLEVAGFETLEKQDLVYKILDQQALKPEPKEKPAPKAKPADSKPANKGSKPSASKSSDDKKTSSDSKSSDKAPAEKDDKDDKEAPKKNEKGSSDRPQTNNNQPHKKKYIAEKSPRIAFYEGLKTRKSKVYFFSPSCTCCP